MTQLEAFEWEAECVQTLIKKEKRADYLTSYHDQLATTLKKVESLKELELKAKELLLINTEPENILTNPDTEIVFINPKPEPEPEIIPEPEPEVTSEPKPKESPKPKSKKKSKKSSKKKSKKKIIESIEDLDKESEPIITSPKSESVMGSLFDESDL